MEEINTQTANKEKPTAKAKDYDELAILIEALC